MLDKIIQFSIKNKLIVGLFTLFLTGYGIYQATLLPIDAVPDITNNQVQIITTTPALGAPDVERLITFPIEQANANIPGLKEIRSFSRFGLSLVTVVFEDGVDIYWARQQISERLQQARSQIPEGVGQPFMAPVTTGLGEIYQYVVRAKPGFETRYSLMELRTIQDWMVRRQLLGTPGVADVSTFGGELRQLEVAVLPERLKAFNLTIQDVFSALQNNNQNTGGAYIEKGPTVLYIRSEGLVGSAADIEQITVRVTGKQTPLRIRDIATVQPAAATRYGAVCYNDEGEVAGAVVMMLKGENSSTVIRQVKERIAAIQKTLPEGVVIEPFLDRTKMVNNAISTVETNLLEGALIVIFVLVVFLGNIRAGLIVASVIPLSMLFAIILMNYFGVGGNLMSLGAIDFGLIVDGAVIVVEAILHEITHSKHFREVNNLSREQLEDEVHHASSRIMNAAIFGQIIILIVYLPILSLEGIEGKMFKPMAQTVGFAVLGAFVLSLTYIPMMSAWCLNRKLSHKKTFSDRMMVFFERWYQHALERVLQLPKTVIAVSLVLMTVSVVIMGSLGGEFIPELEEGDFAVDTRVLTGSSLTTTIAATKQTAAVLLENFPEVEKIVTKIGSGEIPTDPMPIEASDMMVVLKDKKQWTSAHSFDELAEKMSQKIAAIPGVTAGFQFPVQMRFNELMTGARQDVVCKIFGEDLDTLAHYAQKLGEVSLTVEGATELYVEAVNGMPQMVVRYRRDALAQYGLDITTVNNTINAAFAGAVAGQVFEGERRFDLVVRVAGTSRKSASDLQNLPIATPSGVQVPLHQVAIVETIDGPNQIQREDARRRIVVGFNVRGRDIQTIVQELQQKVETTITLPPGYSISYGGAFENLQAAKQRLSIAVPLALVLIFLMLYFAFGSIRQGLLIYSAIPLSAIGGIIALWLRDMPFSISAGIGFIALFGVAVLNGIVLISEFNRLEREGWNDARRIVLMGTKIRLRSILMTALAPSLGFIPMAASMGAGAEVQRPLATVVIGGIISATLLTLFVLPVLYVWFGKNMLAGSGKTAAALLVFALLQSTGAKAQTIPTITLEEVLQQVVLQNPEAQAARLHLQYVKQMQATGKSIEKTEIGVELGRFNSRQFDDKISLSQRLPMPTIFRAQRGLLAADYRQAAAELEVTQSELIQKTGEIYFQYVYWQQKATVLAAADSLFKLYTAKADLWFEQGASNRLEQSGARLQYLQYNRQLTVAKQTLESTLARFNWLLQPPEPRRPAIAQAKLPAGLADNLSAFQWPLLNVLASRMDGMVYQRKLEKAMLLPEVTIGWVNQSIIGYQVVGGADRYFNRYQRFNYLTAGVALPVFSKAQRARLKALDIQAQKVQLDYNWLKNSGMAERDILRREILMYQDNLEQYRTVLLPQAATTATIATARFDAGEIDFLEFTLLLQQQFDVQQQFLQEQLNFNLAVLRFQQFSAQ